eukprot:CAMPEP_0198286258 /NCGR_PEP_ID=MMETSP1449-20131203/5385_1 /TAXON_ID=420275 /ORGANISM="Attheya septentrionalis, Strain CCMP2084" /LENGTH=755 /DNA_ID=CAMNT_0043983947 /DNA_START=122 /DNA_END=2389 /DNA_ORIENTATION=-
MVWTGVPSGPDVVATVRESIHDVILWLEIPSSKEYLEVLLMAMRDVGMAMKSSYRLWSVTLRPLWILGVFVAHWLWVGLQVLGRHSIKHGIVAARNGAIQLSTGAKWFWALQKTLSRAAIAMELGVVAVCIGLLVLRRWIRRKKYVERVTRYYRRRKNAAFKKYNNAIYQIARTSLFLAMLLPHLLYIAVVGGVKLVLPQLGTYFATRTYALSILSLWYPFLRTVLLLHRYRGHQVRSEAKKANAELSNHKPLSRPKTSGHVSDRWLRAAKEEEAFEKEECMEMKDEALDLLKYWTVYALLSAFFRVLYLSPIVGRIFSNFGITAPVALEPRGLGRFTSFRFSCQFMDEVQLTFFVWLCLLPTSLTSSGETTPTDNSAAAGDDSVKAKAKKLEKKNITKAQMSLVHISNRPLDLVYDQMSPLVVSILNASNTLTARAETGAGGSSAGSGILYSIISKFQSVLDIAVLVRFMSKKTKESIVNFLTSSVDLLPAAMTFVMPGYFTQFGVVYAKAIVPAAKSSLACNLLKRQDNTYQDILMALPRAVRFLEYWIIYSLLSGILGMLAPLLAWVPLSTHLTLLVWSIAQLERVTHGWYQMWETELISFGLLEAHDETKNMRDISETVTVRMLKKLSSSLPSAASSSSEQGKAPKQEETMVPPVESMQKNSSHDETGVASVSIEKNLSHEEHAITEDEKAPKTSRTPETKKPTLKPRVTRSAAKQSKHDTTLPEEPETDDFILLQDSGDDPMQIDDGESE